MTKRMLIDATHAEETRVVVLDGSRLEDYDVETSTKRQLKGNIYLAKIVRVEPSLQAAFVEYGGNRHGFLAFGEIHPDYYQLPVADRQRLLDMQEAEAREEEEAEDEAARKEARNEGRGQRAQPAEMLEAVVQAVEILEAAVEGIDAGQETEPAPALPDADQVVEADTVAPGMAVPPDEAEALFPAEQDAAPSEELGTDLAPEAAEPDAEAAMDDASGANGQDDAESVPAEPPPEQIGGETDGEETAERRSTPRFLRNYKIQEVIRRRQILLVQVVKEERGTKGAALTTYISLAGRFSVLMPNSPRGGGISRKITSAADRRRLKEVTAELDLPRGMGLIVRTAGANRPKPEIMRDGEYLLDQWDQIRDLTMKSTAPALIYEEANLIKRSIRDVYSRDVEDVLVDGEGGWRAARDFMRMLMPAHARKVQLWKEPQPLFAKQQVEAQLDAMLSPTVQLKSGGYLVINQTEALVAIDVNSGRSTRERGIEATALGTNLEAADEVARQLRLRDLAGLIVIDFIDMEARRSNGLVEARLKNALKNDRARIQVGSISHFGLLEMSRQRLRPSLAETSFVACPHCGGTGHVRSTESAALHVLRGIEEEGAKRRAAEVVVHVASSIALYILNHKRGRLTEIEMRYGMRVAFASDDSLLPPQMRIDRVRALVASELPPPVSQIAPPEPAAEVADPIEDEDEDIETAELDDETEAEEETSEAPRPGETAEEGQRRRKRRRRRGRGRREEGAPESSDGLVDQAATGEAGEQPGATPVEIAIMPAPPPALDGEPDDEEAGEDTMPEAQQDVGEAPADEEARAKRRGRRGGRRRRRDAPEGGEAAVTPDADVPAPAPEAAAPYPAPAYPAPSYSGPTPADPFGGNQAFDIYDVMAQEEARREAEEIASRLLPAPEIVIVEPVRTEASFAPDLTPSEPEPAPEDAASQLAPAPEPETAEPVRAEASPAPDAAMPLPEPDAAPEPAPALAESDAAPVEKKRGWWRR